MPRPVSRNVTKPRPQTIKGDDTAALPVAPYHHGGLRDALLRAAETILMRDGQDGLTLRAAARAAGVSHAAPKNHFGDLRGLLSDLAAIGYERFQTALTAAATAHATRPERAAAVGRAYVRFARTHPALFVLMFRSDRLDFTRPALQRASTMAFAALAGQVAEQRNEAIGAHLTLPQAASLAATWAGVHGLAMLLIDGRLAPILARLPPGTSETALLDAIGRELG